MRKKSPYTPRGLEKKQIDAEINFWSGIETSR